MIQIRQSTLMSRRPSCTRVFARRVAEGKVVHGDDHQQEFGVCVVLRLLLVYTLESN